MWRRDRARSHLRDRTGWRPTLIRGCAPAPAALYSDRRNSTARISAIRKGDVEALRRDISAARPATHVAGPIVYGILLPGSTRVPSTNPADRRDQVGSTRDAQLRRKLPAHSIRGARRSRGWILRAARAARGLAREGIRSSRPLPRPDFLISSWCRKPARPYRTAIAEVRRSGGFLPLLCAAGAAAIRGAGAAGRPHRRIERIGPCTGGACSPRISPWNFPLAIFAGQVTRRRWRRETARGRETGRAHATDCRALRQAAARGRCAAAGVAPGARRPGASSVKWRFAHPGPLAGVAMTGSTATALTINRSLAARGGAIVPLIAETGGMNAMIVDSTALPEQVVDDVLARRSQALASAARRCGCCSCRTISPIRCWR